jgi:hypothetical protein
MPARPALLKVVVALVLALVSVGMAAAPLDVASYVVGNLTYAFAVGLAYATWTAAVFHAMGARSAATKYTIFASLSNFPNWWLGLLLGVVADDHGPLAMLVVEGAIGVAVMIHPGFGDDEDAQTTLLLRPGRAGIRRVISSRSSVTTIAVDTAEGKIRGPSRGSGVCVRYRPRGRQTAALPSRACRPA